MFEIKRPRQHAAYGITLHKWHNKMQKGLMAIYTPSIPPRIRKIHGILIIQ
jgi:hypothetical protein